MVVKPAVRLILLSNFLAATLYAATLLRRYLIRQSRGIEYQRTINSKACRFQSQRQSSLGDFGILYHNDLHLALVIFPLVLDSRQRHRILDVSLATN